MSDTFILGQGPGHKLEKAVTRNGGGSTDIEWLSTGENFTMVMALARGEATLTLNEKPATKVEVLLNTIIRVDRTVKPVYPDWLKEVMHPELELAGPAEYDLSKVELWLHEGQTSGRKWTEGNNVYARLKENNNELLKTCLTLRDGEEIQKNGIEAFCKFFEGKALFLWGSVVRDRVGNLGVPCLSDGGDGVVVGWRWLGSRWYDYRPAGRFAS